MHGVAGECLEGQWLNEGLGACCHDHLDGRPGIDKPSRKYSAFVGRDTARNSQENFFVIQGLHACMVSVCVEVQNCKKRDVSWI